MVVFIVQIQTMRTTEPGSTILQQDWRHGITRTASILSTIPRILQRGRHRKRIHRIHQHANQPNQEPPNIENGQRSLDDAPTKHAENGQGSVGGDTPINQTRKLQSSRTTSVQATTLQQNTPRTASVLSAATRQSTKPGTCKRRERPAFWQIRQERPAFCRQRSSNKTGGGGCCKRPASGRQSSESTKGATVETEIELGEGI